MMSIKELVVFFGGWSIVLTSIILYLFNRVADKLTLKWKETADANIARLEGEIQKNNNTLGGLLSMYGANHQQAQERRIKAVELLWSNLSKFKGIVPASVSQIIYGVLGDKEIENFWSRQTDNANFNAIRIGLQNINYNLHFKIYYEFVDNIENERPFLGERIWQCFEVYKMFLGRIMVIIHEGTEKERFNHWQKDEALKDFFKKTLSEKEFQYIYSVKINSYSTTCALLENKLLREIDRSLSGERMSENALEQVKKFDNFHMSRRNSVDFSN